MNQLVIFLAAVLAFFSFKGYGISFLDSIDESSFNEFSVKADVPGTKGVRTLKFLVKDVHTSCPHIYFINTKEYKYHYDFADEVLKLRLNLEQFNRQTYFTDNRTFLAGTILSYDNFIHQDGRKGAYVFEFYPTDPVKFEFTNKVFDLLSVYMKFALGNTFYHPAGETHLQLLEDEKEKYEESNIPVLTSDILFKDETFSPLHLGEAFGYLQIASPSHVMPYSIRDIVIFRSIPNELSHVAGVITEEPQTPLSHINLKAKQNNTPNAFLKEASSKLEIRDLIGQPVYFKVKEDGIELRPASFEEIEFHLEKIRPPMPQTPLRDLSETRIKALQDIRNRDSSIFGAKAANIGEMKAFLSEGILIPDGFAIPFFFYHTFMTETNLYEYAVAMIQDPEFKNSPKKREQALKLFRKKIKQAEMPAELQKTIDHMHAQFPVGRALRCRSSTNNEDLPGFNGAGLYDSFTHRLDEGNISKTIKQVFSSLWNLRAFEEREFYRIDHFQTAMGVLVHPNFDDELANGVAVTKNPYNSDGRGCYINVQVGEALVTNPDPGATPEEVLVMETSVSNEEEGFEIIPIHCSNLVAKGKKVMTEKQLKDLANQLRKIQNHFLLVYDKKESDRFAMDVEFKINQEGFLVIKQARPWID